MTPEAEARQTIDDMLEASGWQIQDYAEHATDASLGIAVREYPLQDEQQKIPTSTKQLSLPLN